MADTRQDGTETGVVISLLFLLAIAWLQGWRIDKSAAEIKTLRQQLSQQQTVTADGCEGRK